MRTAMYVLFYKNHPALIAATLLLVMRVIQALALAKDTFVIGRTFEDAYAFCNAANTAAFVLTPLFAIAVMRPAAMMADSHFAVWSKSRRTASLRCLAVMFLFGLSASAALNASTAAVVALTMPNRMDGAVLMCSLTLQAMVCSIAFMIYMDLLCITGRASIAFMGCTLYGLWDFMAQNVVGGGIPSVGWGLTIVSGNSMLGDAVSRLSLFGMAIVALFLVLFFVFQQKDYVAARNER